jgi:glycosyltransferase involved in cell wall biosynthesis
MRILFLTENYPPEVNAIATRVSERAAYWVRHGHSVTVITGFPNFPQGKLYAGWRQRWFSSQIVDGIRVVRVRTYIARNEAVVKRTLDFVSFMISAVIASIRLPRPDVVVATSPQFFAAVGGWIVSILKRRPFVFELSDLWPASIRAVGAMRAGPILDLVERLELFLYRRSARVVALTAAFKRDLVRRGIEADKIAVVLNGVDLPRYSPRARDPELALELGLNRCFVIGYIGTHGMAHDLMNVVEAAELLRSRTDICFLFVGDGAAKPELVASVRQRRLDNVVFSDPRHKEQMPACWSVCDVALVHLKDDPVFSEVIPSKLFEAMAMGLPVLIAAPAGEATSIVAGERAGIVVTPSSPEALAAAIGSLADNPAQRAALASHSLAAAPRYTRERQAEEMEAVLQAVVHAR